MLIKDLRNKDNNELMQLVENLKAELFMLRFQNKTGQLDKPHKISQVKKDIAKVFTIINARSLNLEKQIKSKNTSSKTYKINQQEEFKHESNPIIAKTKDKEEAK